jgi:hypothetical protein
MLLTLPQQVSDHSFKIKGQWLVIVSLFSYVCILIFTLSSSVAVLVFLYSFNKKRITSHYYYHLITICHATTENQYQMQLSLFVCLIHCYGTSYSMSSPPRHSCCSSWSIAFSFRGVSGISTLYQQ